MKSMLKLKSLYIILGGILIVLIGTHFSFLFLEFGQCDKPAGTIVGFDCAYPTLGLIGMILYMITYGGLLGYLIIFIGIISILVESIGAYLRSRKNGELNNTQKTNTNSRSQKKLNKKIIIAAAVIILILFTMIGYVFCLTRGTKSNNTGEGYYGDWGKPWDYDYTIKRFNTDK